MLSNSGNRFFLLSFFLLFAIQGFGMPLKILAPSEDTTSVLIDTTFKVKNFPLIPDSLMSHEAIMLSMDREFSYRIDNSNDSQIFLNETQVLKRKIKILTNKGLTDYSIINLKVNKYFHIEKFSIHLIKPNGKAYKVITEIRSVQNPDDDLKLQEKELRISIPNIEVGDIVDFDLKFSNPTGFCYPIEVFINEEIPLMNSSLTLKFRKGLHTKTSTYNGMSQPIKSADPADSIFSWTFPYLQAEPELEHSIPANELPFIRYMITGVTNPAKYGLYLNYADLLGSWGIIFHQFANQVKRDDPRPKKHEYYQEFLYNQWNESKNMTGLQKLQKVVSFINDSVKLVNNEPSHNFSSGYYLFNRKIDYLGELILYQDLFRSLNFEFYYVFVRPKVRGEIDTNFVSRHMYYNYMFAFRENEGDLHFLYPMGLYYHPDVDQIPMPLQGTSAILSDASNPRNYKIIRLPQWDSHENKMDINGKILFNLEDNTLTSDVKIIYTGLKSHFRKENDSEEKDSLKFNLEKNLKEKFDGFTLLGFQNGKREVFFPFKDSIRYQGKQKNVLTKIEEGTYAFPLSSWLDHSELLTRETNRKLDYYTNPYSEILNYEFTFPFPVELLNLNKLQCNYSNIYGSYQLVVKQIDATTISVQSTYKIEKEVIPKQDYSLLKEINHQLKNFKDAKLMIHKR
jgi:hypothetical protein